MKNLVFSVAIFMFCALTVANAQQITDERLLSPKSDFSRLFDNKNVIVSTERYDITTLRDGLAVQANVGWIDGSSDKLFAATIGGVSIDFEQLKNLQSNLEKLAQKIESTSDNSNFGSLYYSSSNEFYVNCYGFTDDAGKGEKNIYIKFGYYVSQSQNTKPLRETINLIKQVREKLISLGAK